MHRLKLFQAYNAWYPKERSIKIATQNMLVSRENRIPRARFHLKNEQIAQ